MVDLDEERCWIVQHGRREESLKQLKNNTKSVIWTRIEATSGLGIPDFLAFTKDLFG